MKLLIFFLGLAGLTVGLVIVDRVSESGLHASIYVSAYILYVAATILEQIIVSRKQKHATS
ncbi:hypothetical protein [Oceanobacillus oncorhynchi]|uniref:hypothetical protein n=1 Tax=Oceanobacillus oncorhynchi TaxID=545501 RepID=UPI0034D65E66